MSILVVMTGRAYRGRKRLVKRLASEGAVVVSLDLDASQFLDALGISYVTLNDLIPHGAWRDIERTAALMAQDWEELLPRIHHLGAPHWATLDRAVLQWSWHELATAIVLAERSRGLGFRQIHLFGLTPPRAAIYSNTNDVGCLALRDLLSQHAEVRIHRPGPAVLFRHLVSRVRSSVRPMLQRPRKSTSLVSLGSESKPTLLCVLNPHEVSRFDWAVQRLSAEFQVLLATTDATPPDRTRITQAIHRRRFTIRAVRKLREFLPPSLAAMPTAMEVQFLYLVKHRWPELSRTRTTCEKLLKQVRPVATIVSSLDDFESQTAAEQSRQLGIPAIAFPHSHVTRAHSGLHADVLVVQYRFQTAIVQTNYPTTSVAARQVLPDLVYPSGPNKSPGPNPKRILIVGADVLDYVGGGVLRLSLLRDQMRIIETLSYFAHAAPSSAEFVVKFHPATQYRTSLQDACEKFGLTTAAPTDSLDDWIRASSAVVAINLAGSAILAPRRFRRPTFVAFTEDFVGLANTLQLTPVMRALSPSIEFQRLTLERALREAMSLVLGDKLREPTACLVDWDSEAFQPGEQDLLEAVSDYLRQHVRGSKSSHNYVAEGK